MLALAPVLSNAIAQCCVGDEQPLVEQQFPEQGLALSQGPVAWASPGKELQEAVGGSRGGAIAPAAGLFQRGCEHLPSTMNRAVL